jgi:hypothetical protein
MPFALPEPLPEPFMKLLQMTVKGGKGIGQSR